MNTPWGQTQSVHEVAEGIWWVFTASHGGIHLSEQRAKDLATIIPTAQPWTGDLRWLEEDVDWAYAPLAFPVAFDNQTLFNAVRTAHFPEARLRVPEEYWQEPCGVVALAGHAAYTAETEGMWERGSCWCGGGKLKGWGVSMRRGDERIEVEMPEYPRKQFYTDAEIAGMRRL